MTTPQAQPAAGPGGLDAAGVKACCVAGYDHDLVGLLLGDSYHPGGIELSRRLARLAEIGGGTAVADVASGPGTTAIMLAAEFGAVVEAVDLRPSAVAAGQAQAAAAGLTGRLRFHTGDAERLPLPDASVDVVVCECSLCTFPDKETAVAEMARVLRPGGKAALSDVTVDRARLDPDLAGLAGWIACLADARTLDGYIELLCNAGLPVTHTESHPDALAEMISAIEARLAALAGLHLTSLEGVDLDAGKDLARRAARAVADGTASYALVVAAAPGPTD